MRCRKPSRIQTEKKKKISEYIFVYCHWTKLSFSPEKKNQKETKTKEINNNKKNA